MMDPREKARRALHDAILHGNWLDPDALTRTAVDAILEAAREQTFHDLAARDPKMHEALRSAGLIA